MHIEWDSYIKKKEKFKYILFVSEFVKNFYLILLLFWFKLC